MKQWNLRTREVNSNLRCFCDRRLLPCSFVLAGNLVLKVLILHWGCAWRPGSLWHPSLPPSPLDSEPCSSAGPALVLFVHSFWWPSLGWDKMSHFRDRNFGDLQFCFQWVPGFSNSSHSSENSVLAVAVAVTLLLHTGLEKLHQCPTWASPGWDRGRLEWKAFLTKNSQKDLFPFFNSQASVCNFIQLRYHGSDPQNDVSSCGSLWDHPFRATVKKDPSGAFFLGAGCFSKDQVCEHLEDGFYLPPSYHPLPVLPSPQLALPVLRSSTANLLPLPHLVPESRAGPIHPCYGTGSGLKTSLGWTSQSPEE